MTRHAAGDGVNGVVDLDAAGDEQVGELPQRALRLRNSEPVPGNEDHLVRIPEHDRDVVRSGRAHRAISTTRPAPARSRAIERTEECRGDRPAHGLGHLSREERARCTDKRAGNDEEDVSEDVAARRDREAGEGIEKRDDDRDVGAADRQHEQNAHEQCQHQQRHEQPCLRCDHQPDSSGEGCGSDENRHVLSGRDDDRPARHELLKLQERDDRTAERHRSDDDGEDRRDERERIVRTCFEVLHD